jgi:hypothetical protein
MFICWVLRKQRPSTRCDLCTYSITVNLAPNPEYEGFAANQIAAANRTKHEAVIAAAKAEQDNHFF